MKNPNGYGTVAKLSGKRRRPYIIKKTIGWKTNGHPICEIIGYAKTREEGNMILAEYNRDPWDVDRAKITLKELFELWKEKKMPKLGESNRGSLCAAYKYCSRYEDVPYKLIRAYQMQETIDECGHGYSTQGAIKNLWGHLDRFALELDVTARMFSRLLTSDPVPQTSRDRFDDETIKRIWDHAADPWVDTILILIYSGWRITELLTMKKSSIDLQAGIMEGGIKSKAGKHRIVPIHPLIRPMIEQRMKEPGDYLIQYRGNRCSDTKYREIWKDLTATLDIPGTPHWCRHTFESLLDSAGGNRKCIDLLMGHVSKDTGNRVYNHKTIEELRSTIELLKKP